MIERLIRTDVTRWACVRTLRWADSVFGGTDSQAREIAGGEPFRLMFDQQAERLQPRALGKSGERIECRAIVSISREFPNGRCKSMRNSIIPEIPFGRRLRQCHECDMKLDDAAAHLEALGNPTRLKIYRALVRAGDAGLSVGRLQDKLKIAPSTLSHHVKTLVTAGLITQVREATTLTCHANYDVMRGLVDFLVAECCADAVECKDASATA
jgi:DNA-binding transcriptional ArsR family regulator